MTQFALPTIDPLTASGTDLANWLNSWNPALLSSHSGTVRPAYALPGTLWVDTTTPTAWKLKLYDGTHDNVAFQVDSTTGSSLLTTSGITGDMTNAIRKNRLNFQTNVPNGSTLPGVLPNGSSKVAAWNAYGAADPDNCAYAQFGHNGTDAYFQSTAVGTGVQGKMQFMVGASSWLQLDSAGALTFTQPSQRIKGDFTNATPALRTCFQTSVVNGTTLPVFIPNGSGTLGGIMTSGGSDPNNASLGSFYTSNTNTFIDCNKTGTGTYGALVFNVGGSLRFQIANDGSTYFYNNVTIVNNNAITAGIAVIGDTSYGVTSYTSNASDSGGTIVYGRTDYKRGGSSQPTQEFQLTFNYGSVIGSITTTPSATQFNTSSDYRLKNAMGDIGKDGFDRVMAARPRLFSWKNDPTGAIQHGFFAHEFFDAFGVGVSGKKDAVDDEGQVIPQQLEQSQAIPDIVAAIHYLASRIDAVEAKVH